MLLTDEQISSIIDFIRSSLNDEGSIKGDLTQEQFGKNARRMLRAFNLTAVELFDQDNKKSDYEVIEKVTSSIRTLKRIGVKPTLKVLAKMVRKNKWTLRNIMAEHGMYCPETREIKDIFERLDFNFDGYN